MLRLCEDNARGIPLHTFNSSGTLAVLKFHPWAAVLHFTLSMYHRKSAAKLSLLLIQRTYAQLWYWMANTRCQPNALLLKTSVHHYSFRKHLKSRQYTKQKERGARCYRVGSWERRCWKGKPSKHQSLNPYQLHRLDLSDLSMDFGELKKSTENIY